MEAELQSENKHFVPFCKICHRYFCQLACCSWFSCEGLVSSVQFRCEIWVGVGTLILLSFILLTIYTLSCHSLRTWRRKLRLLFVREFRKAELQGVALLRF